MSLKEIKLPDLGEGVTEGELIKIRVSEGDWVAMDQVLLEVMTDKASMEIPSYLEGTVKEVKAKEGDMVSVGQVIFLLETEGEAPSPVSEKEKEDTARAVSMGERAGATSKGASLATEVKGTDTSSKKPPVTEIKGADTSSKEISSATTAKGTETSSSKKTPPVTTAKGAVKSSESGEDFVLSAPATRQLARELGIDLKSVKPSGPEGQRTRENLIRHIRSRLDSSVLSPLPSEEAVPLSVQSAAQELVNKPSSREGIVPSSAEMKREPLRGIRKIMFETMSHSKKTIPHFTVIERAKVDSLVKIRTELKEKGAKQNVKITYLPFIMKSAVSALKEFPVLNSFYDEERKELVYLKSVHFGFAVDTPKGLLVPVIKDVQKKTLLEIAKRIGDLGERARDGTIQREELRGGTFTFTNLGSLGGISGTPIIYPPQTAILGIYRIYSQPVKSRHTGEWESASYMNFSLTCDHRFIDGAVAVRFLRKFTDRIEEPGLLVLE